MTNRRLSLTIAAFCLSTAAGLALLRVLEEVAVPALSGLLLHYGIVR